MPPATKPDWCDFPYAWAALTVVAVIDVVWLLATGLTLPLGLAHAAFFLMMVATRIGAAIYASHSQERHPYIAEAVRKAATAMEYLSLCDITGWLFAVMSYIVCGWAYTLIDTQLQGIDLMLGFDRREWLAWSQEFVRGSFLAVCYASLISQVVVFAAWHAVKGNKKRLYEIFWALLASITATILLSGIWPALGPAHLMGLEETYKLIQPEVSIVLAQTQALRAGQPIDSRINI